MSDEIIQQNIFKAYDIRGIVDTELTDEAVYKIGQAVGSDAINKKQRTICVGYDGRLSSPSLCEILTQGLLTTGINVINIGLVTTPILYFSTHNLKTKTGIMITGSHNPPNYNGFKIVIDDETLSSKSIKNLYKKIIDNNFVTGKGSISKKNIVSQYKEDIKNSISLKRPMKIAIDCGNGAAGVCVQDLYESLNMEVEALFSKVDGNFPNHHPDPSNPKNLEDLQETLANGESEIGLAFDGDADRLGVVTKSGEIIYPDRQLLLFAKYVLKDMPNSPIIFDVKCTRHLFSWIESHGGKPIIWKTGHSLIKAKMKEINAPLAGEMSGHTFFNDRWYGFDDGIYAGARLVEILSGFDNPSEVLEALPKSISTPELNVSVIEGQQHEIIKKIQMEESFKGSTEVLKIDGVRAEYPYGFGLMRASNTTPVIVLRFEADSKEMLKKIRGEFKIILKKYIKDKTINF